MIKGKKIKHSVTWSTAHYDHDKKREYKKEKESKWKIMIRELGDKKGRNDKKNRENYWEAWKQLQCYVYACVS